MTIVVIRPPGRAPYTVSLERLTKHIQVARRELAISRDDLKKKRLQAMGVVATEMQATADMYERVIAAGSKVSAARTAAETAHMNDLNAQIADLNEMAEELQEFGQSVPTTGGTQSASTVSPAATTTTPALAALQHATPGKLTADAWQEGQQIPGTLLR